MCLTSYKMFWNASNNSSYMCEFPRKIYKHLFQSFLLIFWKWVLNTHGYQSEECKAGLWLAEQLLIPSLYAISTLIGYAWCLIIITGIEQGGDKHSNGGPLSVQKFPTLWLELLSDYKSLNVHIIAIKVYWHLLDFVEKYLYVRAWSK